MYAVIKTGGKQYRVSAGDQVRLEQLSGETGEQVQFEKVLLVSDEDQARVGQPYLEGAKVVGRILRNDRERKIVVFKYKRRKGYRRKKGHRQDFSLVQIEDIQA